MQPPLKKHIANWKLEKLSLPGVKVVTPITFEDERGSFIKTYHNLAFQELGMDFIPAEEFHTVSKKNVIRGMHIQFPPFEHTKVVHCTSGQILDVILDVRKSSASYGHVISRVLSAANREILYIPAGCAHGFLSLAENSMVVYQTSTVYHAEQDGGILWNSIPFDWGIETPIVSQRDHCQTSLQKFNSPFA